MNAPAWRSLDKLEIPNTLRATAFLSNRKVMTR
jgi:hypothetical protein